MRVDTTFWYCVETALLTPPPPPEILLPKNLYLHLDTTLCSLYMLMLCRPLLLKCNVLFAMPPSVFLLSECLYSHSLCCSLLSLQWKR